MEAVYIQEIDVLFKTEFNTTQSLAVYISGIYNNVEKWIDVLIFVRKQARFLIHLKYDSEEVKAASAKCQWIGQIYVTQIVSNIPRSIVREVMTKMGQREQEEKHKQKMLDNMLQNMQGTVRLVSLTSPSTGGQHFVPES